MRPAIAQACERAGDLRSCPRRCHRQANATGAHAAVVAARQRNPLMRMYASTICPPQKNTIQPATAR